MALEYTSSKNNNMKFVKKKEFKSPLGSDVSDSVAFARWIGERMQSDKWFSYDGGRWYVYLEGHLTTEKLHEMWLASTIDTTTV